MWEYLLGIRVSQLEGLGVNTGAPGTPGEQEAWRASLMVLVVCSPAEWMGRRAAGESKPLIRGCLLRLDSPGAVLGVKEPDCQSR